MKILNLLIGLAVGLIGGAVLENKKKVVDPVKDWTLDKVKAAKEKLQAEKPAEEEAPADPKPEDPKPEEPQPEA